MNADGCGYALRWPLLLPLRHCRDLRAVGDMFHHHYDAIVRIPFVWGCIIAALSTAGVGLKQLLPSDRRP